MPLPTQLLFTFASGLASALAARSDLRISPKPAAMSKAFGAYLLFAGLVLLPVSLYFYVFHGDWYLLYAVPTDNIPSAIALLGCVLQLGLGAIGFLLGASLVRTQRDRWAVALIAASALVGLSVVPIARHRLSVVGTYAQYHGDFGLAAYGGALLQGTLWMTLWMGLGLSFLVFRLAAGQKRA